MKAKPRVVPAQRLAEISVTEKTMKIERVMTSWMVLSWAALK